MPGVGAVEHGDRRIALAIVTAWAIVVGFVGSLVLTPWPDALFAADFVAFWTGGSLVREGAGPSLFDPETQRGFQIQARLLQATVETIRIAPGFDPFHNPPPVALLFVPLTFLPMPWAFALFSAASVLALALALALPLRGRPFAAATAAGLLTFGAVGDTLVWGRIDGFLTLAFSLALVALGSRRPLLGGALLGVLWLKPQYAVLFALVLLVKRRWQALTGMVAAALSVAGLSLLMVGTEGITLYFDELRRIGAFYPPASAVINAPMMVNWRALLMALWPGVPETTGYTIVLLLAGATTLASMAAWRGEWEPDSPQFACQMLVTACATVIVALHSHFNATVILLAPLALALARSSALIPQPKWWRPMLGLGFMLGLILWPFYYLRWLMLPYLLISMGLLTWQLWAQQRDRVVAVA